MAVKHAKTVILHIGIIIINKTGGNCMFKNNLIFIVTAILVFSACLTFTSCNREIEQKTETTTNIKADESLTSLTFSENESQNNEQDLDIGGSDLILHKYRQNYYTIPAPFGDIVDSEEFEKWYSDILLLNPNETNKMIIKEFVLFFDVPKESFERANLEWAKIVERDLHGKPVMNPQDFSNQETDEVYNVDIVYTLDDETINNYYLSHDYPYTFSDEYEEAVSNGTYQTRTTDWVDIEQMEAEIIAKYGEVEAATETTTFEEIATTDLSETETTK